MTYKMRFIRRATVIHPKMGMYDDMNSTAQERHMVTGVGELEYYPIIKKYKWKSNLFRCNEMNPTGTGTLYGDWRRGIRIPFNVMGTKKLVSRKFMMKLHE
jgi:hypothetical protein